MPTRPDHQEPADTPVAAVPTRTRAVVGRRYGDPHVLAVEDVPTPTPGAREVLVAVEGSSLNPADWHMTTGTPYVMRPVTGLRRPRHPVRGADVAGTVVAVGADVADLHLGDAVFGECRHGAFATHVAVDHRRVAPVPPGVPFRSAAASPMAGLTALQALRTCADVQPGERVLVNGAAGGVGTFAVQIATALGAEVTGVCSTRNVELVRGLGAVEVVDYRTDDVVAGGARFDVMVDNVGNRTAQECLAVLRPGGRYVAVSGPKANRWLGPLADLARRTLAFRRTDRRLHQLVESPNRDDLTVLGELLAAGRVTPVVDRVIGLDGVASGLAAIAAGHVRGKIVVEPTSAP